MNTQWKIYNPEKELALTISKALHISEITAQLLVNRGIFSPEDAKRFLTVRHEHDSNLLADMDCAIERISLAIKAKEKIMIYTDYDVDGCTSAAILHIALMACHAEFSVIIPERKDGYGLSIASCGEILSQDASLLITADCGITSREEIEFLADCEVDTIVTDHHIISPEHYPTHAKAVINPKREDSAYPFTDLCGAGICYKLVQALSAKFPSIKEVLSNCLQLACIGTIADVVSLTDENRTIVQEGLSLINDCQACMPPIAKLCATSRMEIGSITAQDIAYKIGPRLNAAGRMASPRIAYEFLIALDDKFIQQRSKELDGINAARQSLEREVLLGLEKQITAIFKSGNCAIILEVKSEHESLDGIIGIIAGKLASNYNLPTVIFTRSQEGQLKGSARSIPGIDIHHAFSMASEHILNFGGHASAAGITIRQDALSHFGQAINAYVAKHLTKEMRHKAISIDMFLTTDAITPQLYHELGALAPFGEGNPAPVFALKGVAINSASTAKGNTLRCQIHPNIACIGFGLGDRANDLLSVPRSDIAFQLEQNEYAGKVSLQLNLQDIRLSNENISVIDQLYFEYRDTNQYANIGASTGFNTKVVGVSFSKRGQEIIPTLKPHDVIDLIREPANPYDANAIQILFAGEAIGFLKKDIAKEIAPLIDKGAEYNAYVTQVTGGGNEKNYGLNIFVFKSSNAETNEKLLAKNRRKTLSQPILELKRCIKERIIGKGHKYHAKQAEAIKCLGAGQNTLIIFGTGRGKSAVFQTHAVKEALLNHKKTIIIYPLRALANDQCIQMQHKLECFGVRVLKINGSLDGSDRLAAEAQFECGDWDIAITTPEFLHCNLPLFAKQATEISFVVIDEAHHIGHSAKNRPAYARLQSNLQQLYPITICAATATAGNAVAEAITGALAIKTIIIDDFCRKNLSIVDKRGINNADKEKYILSLVKDNEKCLIYTNSKKKAYDLACTLRERLPDKKDLIGFYHGSLSAKWRNNIEGMFKSGELQVIVSTSAFGEGIDLPDIKNIVQYHMNFSYTDFNQQSGRAGRNGQAATIHLLYNMKDVEINQYILASQSPEIDVIRNIYQCMALLQSKQSAPHSPLQATNGDIAEIANEVFQLNISNDTVSAALRVLEEIQLIKRVSIDSKRYIHMHKPSEKVDISQSCTYQEGLEERKIFHSFMEYAMNETPETLLASVNKPIIPDNPLTLCASI